MMLPGSNETFDSPNAPIKPLRTSTVSAEASEMKRLMFWFTFHSFVVMFALCSAPLSSAAFYCILHPSGINGMSWK